MRLDSSTMKLSGSLGNGETEPASASPTLPCLGHPVKWLKEAQEGLLGHTGALITDDNLGYVPGAVGGDAQFRLHLSAPRSVANRIPDHVFEATAQ